MIHSVPFQKQNVANVSHSCFSFLSARIFPIFIVLIAIAPFLSGCVSQQTKAWNHYEEGMLLVYKGYDPTEDKVDKVEKAFNKAIECNQDIPGVRASLGTYKAKKGEAAGATELWMEERKIHPESKKAMDIVLEKNKEKEKAEMLAIEAVEGAKKTTIAEIEPAAKQIEPVEEEKKNV